MKNKRLTIFLIIFAFFAVIVVLTSTVFALNFAEVKFLSTTNVLTGTEEEILSSANFRFGESVFFSSKSTYIKNIEKSNPYARVVNIETIFPNKFVINIAERNECYAIKLSAGKNKNKYAITDEYLKVLNIVANFQNTTANAIPLENSGLENQDVDVGDFFQTNNDYFKVLFNSLREWKISYLDVKAKVLSIQTDYEKADRLLINMRSGVQIIIENSSRQMSDKINLAYSIFETTTDKNGNEVDYTKSGIILVTETDSKIYALYKPLED